MSQQMGIIVLIDNAAAVESGDLSNNMYLFDNGRWSGSTELGTAHLVTAIEATQSWAHQDVPVLNWIPIGIGGPPPALPQQHFLNPFDRRMIADVPQPQRRPYYSHPRILNALGIDMRQAVMKAGSEQTGAYYPDPVICNVCGEAVEKGVIFPAQYGSPDFYSEGLYWSASVDASKTGLFSYTLQIKLFHSRNNQSVTEDDAIILCQDAFIKITNQATEPDAEPLQRFAPGLPREDASSGEGD